MDMDAADDVEALQRIDDRHREIRRRRQRAEEFHRFGPIFSLAR
jgi:hypothetical protein